MRTVIGALVGAVIGAPLGCFGGTALVGELGGNGQAVIPGFFLGTPAGIAVGALAGGLIVWRIGTRRTGGD